MITNNGDLNPTEPTFTLPHKRKKSSGEPSKKSEKLSKISASVFSSSIESDGNQTAQTALTLLDRSIPTFTNSQLHSALSKTLDDTPQTALQSTMRLKSMKPTPSSSIDTAISQMSQAIQSNRNTPSPPSERLSLPKPVSISWSLPSESSTVVNQNALNLSNNSTSSSNQLNLLNFKPSLPQPLSSFMHPQPAMTIPIEGPFSRQNTVFLSGGVKQIIDNENISIGSFNEKSNLLLKGSILCKFTGVIKTTISLDKENLSNQEQEEFYTGKILHFSKDLQTQHEKVGKFFCVGSHYILVEGKQTSELNGKKVKLKGVFNLSNNFLSTGKVTRIAFDKEEGYFCCVNKCQRLSQGVRQMPGRVERGIFDIKTRHLVCGLKVFSSGEFVNGFFNPNTTELIQSQPLNISFFNKEKRELVIAARKKWLQDMRVLNIPLKPSPNSLVACSTQYKQILEQKSEDQKVDINRAWDELMRSLTQVRTLPVKDTEETYLQSMDVSMVWE